MRTAGQVIVFLIAVRALGVRGYGAYAAVMALAGATGALTGFGVNALLIRDVARVPERFPDAWGRTLASILLSAPLLFVIYLLIAWKILPTGIPVHVILGLGIAEILLAPLAFAAAAAFQGHERIGRTAWMALAPVLPRLMAAVVFSLMLRWLTVDTRLTLWVWLYAGASFLAALYTLWVVHKELGAAVFPKAGILGAWRAGWGYALAGMAQRLYAEIDKTMLASLSSLSVAGLYSAGYRVIDMANIPLKGLLTAVLPRFFRASNSDADQPGGTQALKIVPAPLAYAVFISVAIYQLAGIFPWLLGEQYQGVVPVLRLLAWMPLLAVPRMFFQTVLGGAERQTVVVIILLIGAAMDILLNLWLIPRLAWKGALIATYAAEAFMLTAMLVEIVRARFRRRVR